MKNSDQTKQIVSDFIDAVWNRNDFTYIDDFLHGDFKDHSLPPGMSDNKFGLMQWVAATCKSFEHHSVVEAHVTEQDTSIVKLRMDLKHIGEWRNISPTGISISVVGYRCFKILEQKIIAHWALIDGNAIENQLLESGRGCKVQH